MFTFICANGHETEISDLNGADKTVDGEFYITCGYFESEDEQAARRNATDHHSLSQVRGKVKSESNYMNAMEADELEDWACESPAYLVET